MPANSHGSMPPSRTLESGAISPKRSAELNANRTPGQRWLRGSGHPLAPEGRPGWVARIRFGRDLLFVAAPDVDGEELRPAVPAGVAEEHEDAAIGRPGRAF